MQSETKFNQGGNKVMDSREIFKKYRAKLEREGWFTSAICALGIGCVVVFIMAFAFWMAEVDALWACLVAGLVVAAAVTPLFYFKKFRPDTKEIARRLDRMGLDERMITMTEFAAEDSYIAKLQREDAAVTLKKGEENGKKVKFQLAGGSKYGKVIAFSAGGAAFFAVAMSIVLGLTIMGTLPSGGKLVNGEEQEVYYMVSYMEGDGYHIEGEADQAVQDGGKTTEITAVAEDGWAFVQWSDLEPDDPRNLATRHDENIHEDLTVFAVFQEVGSGDDGDGGGEDGDQDGDQQADADKPKDGSDSGSQSKSDQDQESQDKGDGASNSDPSQDNTVINDEYESVDYQEVYEAYYEAWQKKLASGDYTAEERAFYEAFLDVLK